MHVLDCTLRDGGYYNSWDFEPQLVRAYIDAMLNCGVDLVELGLRNFPANVYRGAHYYSSESYLNRLNLPEGLKYGVMVDAKTILTTDQPIADAVNDLFVSSSSSTLSFVRLACHFDEVVDAEKIVSSLCELGYEVFLNLMQISTKTYDEISQAVSAVSKFDSVAGIYFADSLGNMQVEDIERVISTIGKASELPIGLHAHNNMGQGIRNCLHAIEKGVSYIDCTVGGMGRGAGNAETEILIAELQMQGASRYNIEGLSDLYVRYFEDLKKQYGWGPSIYYYLAARHSIHPSYIQSLLTDPHYGDDERSRAIGQLHYLSGRTTYDSKALLGATEERGSVGGRIKCHDINDVFLNNQSRVLLLGSGSSIERYFPDIKAFAAEAGLTVASVNQGRDAARSIVDYFFFSHNTRSLDYRQFFQGENGSFVVPIERFSNSELDGVNVSDLINYAVTIKADDFEVLRESCILPFDLTVGYAIAALLRLGVREIYMAGFDGYPTGDQRNLEMIELFQIIGKKHPELSLISLTPSHYPLVQGSLYAPIL